MKKLLLGILLLLVLTGLYFLFYPVDFDPVAYSPPENPGFEGTFAPNQALDQLSFILNETGMAPEDIAMGPDSVLYTGFDDGRVVKFSREGELISTLGNTIGRPRGMKFTSTGKLIIADEYQGLISMDELGEVRVLTNEVAGTPIYFADDLDISSEGIIYFTDASQRNHADEIEKEFWELQPTGRLLSYHPASQETRLELSGLRFANGVAIGPNEEYLLVNETVGMQIMKYWLKGPKKGQAEVFFDQLPGYPDNINFDGDSLFWIGLTQARDSTFEKLYEKPFTRKVIARLPKFLTESERVPPMGMILAINLNAEVVHFLQSPEGLIHDITSVTPTDEYLFIGNLGHTAVGKLPIPK
ncbi:MAG: SMP-30/gluconolactonase/LRE family protein [Bacteroidota bacterium]